MAIDNRMNIPPKGYVSIEDAAAQLHLVITSVRRLYQLKSLRGVVRREGLTNRLYIEVASIEEYIANHQGGQQ